MIQFKNHSVCVFESALFRTTSTVVQTDDLLLLVDPTWLPGEIEKIRHFVDRTIKGRPLFLLFTHSDYDHILADQAFPEARTIASRSFVDQPKKEEQLEQIRKFDEEYYITRPYPVVYPEIDHMVDADGQFFSIGNTRLSFWLAPGHNPDGLFTLVEPLGIWLAGDYLSNIEFPFIYHGSRAYEATLDKAEAIIRHYRPSLLIPGHGDVCEDLPGMSQRIEESRLYIHTLREALRRGKEYPEAELWTRYAFPGGQRPFHQENVALLKRELEAERSNA